MKEVRPTGIFAAGMFTIHKEEAKKSELPSLRLSMTAPSDQKDSLLAFGRACILSVGCPVPSICGTNRLRFLKAVRLGLSAYKVNKHT